ncbi:MAG: Re/Si-specific NAD(P)(+) transhydrogenase subunit alpha [Bacteroidia bacterium]|nr:Re/Si-specific NAD(P)(+) transhydrogenase subunit alpha [Bacteroidia bacterium]
MKIGVLGEQGQDNRVPLTPKNVAALLKLGVSGVLVESGAGSRSFISDEKYKESGAEIASRAQVLKESDLIIKVTEPSKEDVAAIDSGKVLVGVFSPLTNHAMVNLLAKKGLSSFSLDVIPRTTRAQAMDILSSMGTIIGYKAVLVGANQLPSFMPMFMTAAGTVIPAKVLILGAGVAGLQAIATAKRLGAVVEAFDVRAAAKEEVLSLGAKFVEVEGAKDDTSAGGYAVEQSEEFLKRQKALVAQHAAQSDLIICSALILGKKAPLLLTRETVEAMKPGSVVVDLAAASGGNCEVTEPGKVISHKGVTIVGETNMASSMPADASMMYGNNVVNFLKIILKDGEINLNMDDDLVVGTLITHQNEVVHARVKSTLAPQS